MAVNSNAISYDCTKIGSAFINAKYVILGVSQN